MGLIVVWTLVRAMAPEVAELTLLSRYAVYAVILSILYHVSDEIRGAVRMPLTPFSGLSAAACAAGPYIQTFGIPASWVITSAVCFGIGYGFYACWSARDGDLNGEIGRQVVFYAWLIVAATTVVLIALLTSFILTFEPAI